MSFFNNLLNGIPVVGHVKGVIHALNDDQWAADEAFKAANRTSVVMAGGALGVAGGPAGIVAGATSAGLLMDSVDSVRTGKPQGIIGGLDDIATDISNGEIPVKSVIKTGIFIGADTLSGFGGGSIASNIGGAVGKTVIKDSIVTVAKQGTARTLATAASASRSLAEEIPKSRHHLDEARVQVMERMFEEEAREQREQEREKERERKREQEREKEREREREQEREKVREQKREQEREKVREQEREQEREKVRELQRKQLIETMHQQEKAHIQQQLERERKFAKVQRREREQEWESERERDIVRHRLLQLERLRLEHGDDEEEEKKKKHPVVVIGCGASGIAALNRLHQFGIPAVGVEATSRIGGRILTIPFGDGVVNLGAQWSHGKFNEIDNPLILLEHPQDSKDPDWYVFSNGTLMPTGNAKDILKCINKEVTMHKHSDKSISRFVRDGVKHNDIKTCPGRVSITQPFLEWYDRNYHLGSEDIQAKEKSLKALTKQETCLEEFYLNWKGKGQSSLDVLLDSKNVNIQYNKEVKNICTTPELDEDDPVPTVLLTFNDGTTMKASRVIVTIPLGVLKQNMLGMFIPPLPQNKIQAINDLQYFVLDKIFIEFERAWWPDEMVNFNILWREEDKVLFKNEKWVTGIYGLKRIEHQTKVLMALIGGPLAEEMENVTDDQISEGIHKFLKRVFSLNFEVSNVTRLTRSKWATNQYAKGAFSYRSVATEKSLASAEVLSQPITWSGVVPVVCFAGEATSHKWHGHVHGAVEAGYREADRILASMPE